MVKFPVENLGWWGLLTFRFNSLWNVSVNSLYTTPWHSESWWHFDKVLRRFVGIFASLTAKPPLNPLRFFSVHGWPWRKCQKYKTKFPPRHFPFTRLRDFWESEQTLGQVPKEKKSARDLVGDFAVGRRKTFERKRPDLGNLGRNESFTFRWTRIRIHKCVKHVAFEILWGNASWKLLTFWTPTPPEFNFEHPQKGVKFHRMRRHLRNLDSKSLPFF